jgi:hypothetical protein
MRFRPQTVQKYDYNPDPRLSAGQLADYLTATAPRRTSIIRDAKFPKAAIVAKYREARSGIVRHLCAGPGRTNHLDEAIARLAERGSGPDPSQWTADDCRDSTAALRIFQSSHSGIVGQQLGFRAINGSLPLLMIAGVGVSVALDATVHRRARDGSERVGGILLFFSKRLANDEAAMERATVSALLCLMFAEKHLLHAGMIDPKLCFALDVFGQRLIPAPSGRTRRKTAIEHSCAEVAGRWAGVRPPRDYDGPPV